MPEPTAIVCLTGSELTRGETRDLNGSFLGAELTSLGVRVVEMRLVPDDATRLEAMIRETIGRAEVVLLSGGLGPTADDLTARVLARVLGREVVQDPAARDAMRRRILERGRREEDIPANFYKQAEIVEGATVLGNPVGLAPGSLVETPRGFVAALPGVPRELRAMFRECVAPAIRERFRPTAPRIVRALVLGQPESWVEARIQEAGLVSDDIDYGISARPGEILLKFVARDPSRHEALDAVRSQLEAVFGADLLPLPEGLNDDAGDPLDTSCARRVHDLLIDQGLTIATAESCTGGLVAKQLTDRGGSSAFFLGSVVAYQNEVKTAKLGVEPDLLAEHGAVSEPVCRAMASGARRLFGSRIALAATGVAGPGGGTADKPVGLVWLGMAGPDDDEILTERRTFWGDRGLVRRQSALRLLDLVRRRLTE